MPRREWISRGCFLCGASRRRRSTEQGALALGIDARQRTGRPSTISASAWPFTGSRPRGRRGFPGVRAWRWCRAAGASGRTPKASKGTGPRRHRAKYDWPGDRVRRHGSEERCRMIDLRREMGLVSAESAPLLGAGHVLRDPPRRTGWIRPDGGASKRPPSLRACR